MPKYVEIDGVGEVEFPDEMDELAIQTAIERDILKKPAPPAAPMPGGAMPGGDAIPPPPVQAPRPPSPALPYMPTGPNTAGPIQGYRAPHDPVAEARGYAYLQQQAGPPAAPQGPYVPPPAMPGEAAAYQMEAPPPPPQQNLFQTPEMAGRQAAGGAPSFMGAVGDAVTFLAEPLRPLTTPFIKGKSYPQEVGERIIDSEKSHAWKKLPEQEKTAILDRARFKFQKGETLSAAEEDAILQDAGFWENVKAFGQQFADHPEPSIRELAAEIIAEGPVFAIGSKGVGSFAKMSRQAIKTQRQAARLAGAKKTLHADRLAGKQGAAPARVLERFAQAEQSAAGRARTVEGLTKANLAKQMGEEAFEEGVTEGAIEAAQATAAGRDALSPQQAAEVAIGGALGAGFGAGKFAVDPKMSRGRFGKIEDRLVFPEGIDKNEGIQTQLRQVEAAGEGRLAKHRVRIEADEDAAATFRKGDQAPAGYEHLADPEGRLLHDLGEGGKFDSRSNRIRVTRDSDESTLPEEYIHAGQEALRQEAAAGDRDAKVLDAKIRRWERQVSRDRTDLPTGDELFGQALNVALGHADKYDGPIRDIAIPGDLVEEFTTFIGGDKVRKAFSGAGAKPRPPAAIATADKLQEGDLKAPPQEHAPEPSGLTRGMAPPELEPPPRSEPIPAEGASPSPAYTREEWRQNPFQLKKKKREEKIISKAQRDKNFKKWFKGSKVADKDGTPKVVYHGTTHDFNEFSKEKGNIENHYGNAFYFSDSEEDVGRNYAGEGPDLTSRIERRAELLEHDFPNLSFEARKRKAKKELKGPHGGAVMPVFLNMKNPVEIEKGGGTFIESAETYNEELDEYEENPDSLGTKLYHAIMAASRDFDGIDAQKVWVDITEQANLFDGATAYDVEQAIRKSEGAMYAESGEYGDLASSEFVRRVWEEMGFDGIIQRDTHKQFSNMGIPYGTSHYIAFKPEQIKSSTGNRGTFDPNNKDIRYQLKTKDAPKFTEHDQVVKGPEREANFKKWFRGSKVVDEKGQPLVVYHGTRRDFDSPSRWLWTTADPDAASGYAADAGKWAEKRSGVKGGENVMPVYMSLQNPLEIDAKGARWNEIEADGFKRLTTDQLAAEAEDNGYDGVIFRNIRDRIDGSGDENQKPVNVYVAFKANQVKSATGNRGTFSPRKGKITFQLKKLPNGEETEKNVPPFYSALYKTIEAKMGGKGKADEIMKMIKAQPGIKPEELEWTGLEKWLAGKEPGKPIPKQEVLDFLKQQDIEIKELQRANSAVKWETYTLPGGKGYRELEFMLPEGYAERKYGPPQKRKDEYWVMNEGGSYQVVRAVQDGHALYATYDTKSDAETQAKILNDTLPANKTMKFPGGTHFPEDNVLAFTRFKTRKTRDGKKVLFIEELQSDWFQKMRDEGAITPTTADEARQVAKDADELLDQIARAFKAKMKEEHGTDPELSVVRLQLTDMWKEGRKPPEKSIPAESWDAFTNLMETRYSKNAAVRAGAPDAPFKDTWHELALKRLLRLAAEEGYDIVAWADAQTHFQRWGGTLMTWSLADRLEAPGGKTELAWDIHYKSQVAGNAGGFDLEREAERLEGDDRFKLTTHGNVKNFPQFRELTENQLSSHQQRQLWKKIQASPEKGSFVGRKEGYDFFYDKAIPQFMGKFAKKLDPEAKLDKYEVELNPPKTASPPARRRDADEDGEYYYEEREGEGAGYYIVTDGQDVEESTDGPYTTESRAQEAIYEYLRESREQDYSIDEIILGPDEGRFQLEERQVGNEVRFFIVDREKVDEEASESPDLFTGEMRYLPAPPDVYTMRGSFPVGSNPVKMSAEIGDGILDESKALEILTAVRDENGEAEVTYRVEGDGAEWADEEDRTFETENEAQEWIDQQISSDIENDDYYSVEYSGRPEWVVYDPAGGEVSVHVTEDDADSEVREHNQRIEDERQAARALTVRNMGILWEWYDEDGDQIGSEPTEQEARAALDSYVEEQGLRLNNHPAYENYTPPNRALTVRRHPTDQNTWIAYDEDGEEFFTGETEADTREHLLEYTRDHNLDNTEAGQRLLISVAQQQGNPDALPAPEAKKEEPFGKPGTFLGIPVTDKIKKVALGEGFPKYQLKKKKYRQPIGPQKKTTAGEKVKEYISRDSTPVENASGFLGNLEDLYFKNVDEATPVLKVQKIFEEETGKKADVQEDIKYAIDRVRGAGGAAKAFINENFAPIYRGGELNGQKLEPLTPAQQKKLDQFLVARRVWDLHSTNPDFTDAGLSQKQAHDYLLELENDPEYHSLLKPRAKLVYAYFRKLAEMKLKAGVWTNEEWALFTREQFYVPLVRDWAKVFNVKYKGASGMTSGTGASGAAFTSINKLVRRIQKESAPGHPVPVFDPVTAAVMDTHLAAKEIAKMRVWNRVVDMREQSKALQSWMEEVTLDYKPEPDEDIVAVRRAGEGEIKRYKVPRELAEAVNDLGYEALPSLIKHVAAVSSLFKRFMVGYNVDFAFANAPRDQQEAYFNSGKLPLAYAWKGAKHFLKKDKVYQDWLKMGGSMEASESGIKSALDRGHDVRYGKELRNTFKGMEDLPKLQRMTEALKRAGKVPLDMMASVGEISEMMTRLGVFENAQKKGLTKEEAVHLSRQATLDFARIGRQMKTANSLVPFLNAAIQGTDRSFRTIAADMKGKNGKIRFPVRTAGRVAVSGLLPMAALLAWNQQNEHYKDIPAREKDYYWILMLGKTGKAHIKLAKGHVQQLFVNPLQMMLEKLLGTSTENGWTTAANILFSLTPIEDVTSAIPPALAVPTEQAIGKDMYFRSDIVKKPGLAPHLQYGPNTSETAKLIGRALQEVPNMAATKWLKSPERLEHVLQGFLGGFANNALWTSDRFLDALDVGEERDFNPTRAPIIRRVFGITQEFRNDMETELRKARKEFREAQAAMSTAGRGDDSLTVAKPRLKDQEKHLESLAKKMDALEKGLEALREVQEKAREGVKAK